MPKRKPSEPPTSKRPAKRKKAAPPLAKVRLSRVRTIILIDNEPLRQAAMSEYLKAESQLENLRAQLEAFESSDRPAYERWEAQLFGALLTEIRDKERELEEKSQFLNSVYLEMDWGGYKPAEAYRRVKEFRENPPPDDPDPLSDDNDSDFEGEAVDWVQWDKFATLPKNFSYEFFIRASLARQVEFIAMFAELARAYDETFGKRAPSIEEVLARIHAQSGEKDRGSHKAQDAANAFPEDGPREGSADSRLKELYRRLVRMLHPDAGGESTARARELWHELQEAYRLKDLERMEAVAGRTDLGLNGTGSGLGVGLLRRMLRDLLETLRGMKFQLNKARKQPAWNFRTRAKDLQKLEQSHRNKLRRRLEGITYKLEEVTEELAQFEKLASGSRKGRKKPKPADAWQADLF